MFSLCKLEENEESAHEEITSKEITHEEINLFVIFYSVSYFY